jgi:hypothetical protein
MNLRSHRPIRLLAALALVLAQMFLGHPQTALAATGDLKADVVTPEGGGLLWPTAISPSVAFDGRYLYYANYAGNVLHRLDVPPLGTTPMPATGLLDIPITGAMSGIMTLAWDAGRGLFWAVSGDGSAIYQLTTAGVATQIFRIGPADRPGFQTGPFPVETKIAYDRSDDTIWYSPDATSRIYHYTTTPTALGTATLAPTPYIDVNVTAQCGFNQSSGVGTGGTSLWITATGCPYFFEYSKTGTQLNFYPLNYTGTMSTQQPACDNLSYPTPVLWIKDGYNSRIRAFEQPAGTPTPCVFGGG